MIIEYILQTLHCRYSFKEAKNSSSLIWLNKSRTQNLFCFLTHSATEDCGSGRSTWVNPALSRNASVFTNIYPWNQHLKMSNILIDILDLMMSIYKLHCTYYNWNDFCFLVSKESGINKSFVIVHFYLRPYIKHEINKRKMKTIM